MQLVKHSENGKKYEKIKSLRMSMPRENKKHFSVCPSSLPTVYFYMIEIKL